MVNTGRSDSKMTGLRGAGFRGFDMGLPQSPRYTQVRARGWWAPWEVASTKVGMGRELMWARKSVRHGARAGAGDIQSCDGPVVVLIFGVGVDER